MKRLLFTLSFIYLTFFASAQNNTTWWKLADTSMSVMDGQAWQSEIGNGTQRLPPRAATLVRQAVWDLSQQSAGLSKEGTGV